ncbi:hypothetical protein [Croceicoccus marinus]|uniref:Uncharacterized protein n=1 Tax=Croceicoccus marinus TaxID=450378 RepID=A0A7G6VZK3_9SPHN|nr:hypothetical protein [Croceicoccus marinus]QNE07168.1 hypothetical protein H4O24_19345 [Croceicoccus marinus]
MTLEIRYPNPGYRLSDRRRVNIANLFDQDLATALTPSGAITIVEQAIFAALHLCEQRAVADSERKSPQSLAANEAQKKRAKRIGKLTAELRVLLDDALREKHEYVDDEEPPEATLPGSLAKVENPELEFELMTLAPHESEARFIEAGSIAYSNAYEQIIALESAADHWLGFLDRRKPGTPKTSLDDLVHELFGASYQLLLPDREALEYWLEKPTASQRTLGLLLDIVLEDTKEFGRGNRGQTIRRALEAFAAQERDFEEYGQQWVRHFEQKYGSDALPFGSQ